eukprot:jgi/Botrbrau1/13427/Bobra.0082s0031.1
MGPTCEFMTISSLSSKFYGLKRPAFTAKTHRPSRPATGFRVSAFTVKFITPTGEHVINDVPGDKYLLDVAEAGGLDLPYSCRAGACSSCAGVIKSGTVDQTSQSFLDDSQLKEGFVLTCVAYATSDLVIETNKEEDLY